MATYTVEINGVDHDVLLDSFRLNLVANGMDRCDVTIESEDASIRPAIDDEVIIKENGVAIFRGPITDAEESAFGGPALVDIQTRGTAIGASSYASFRYVSTTLPAGTLKSQLTALVPYLDDYGVTLDAGQADGPAIDELVLFGMRLDDVLNELSVRAEGWIWTITPDLELLMFQPGTVSAPYDLLDTGPVRQVGDVTIQRSRDDTYANLLTGVVTGAGPATSTECFYAADGVSSGGFTTFTVKYPASQSQEDAWPNELLFDGVNQGPVGRGVEHLTSNGGLFIWAWDYVSRPARLVYDEVWAGFGFPTTEQICVTYAIAYPFEVTVGPIGSPALPRERRIEIPQAMSIEAATAYLENLLAISNTEIVRATFESDDLGWRPGQVLTINLAKRNINASFLIQEVGIASIPGDRGTILRHTITALEGVLLQGNWRNTPKSWLGGVGGGSAGGVATTGGGAALVAPPPQSVQFNRAGQFGGHAALTVSVAETSLLLGADLSVAGDYNLLVGDGHTVS